MILTCFWGSEIGLLCRCLFAKIDLEVSGLPAFTTNSYIVCLLAIALNLAELLLYLLTRAVESRLGLACGHWTALQNLVGYEKLTLEPERILYLLE